MGSAFFGVPLAALALIVAALPLVKLIHLAIDGQIDAGLVAIGGLMYLALIAGVIVGPAPVKVCGVGLIVLSAVFFFLYSQGSAQAGNRVIDDSRFDAYARAVERNPEDPVARIALAEELEKRGDVEQAIQHLEWVLSQHPRLGARHQVTLDMWRRQLARQGQPSSFFCHRCRAEQPPGADRCRECGVAFGTAVAMRERIAQDGGPIVILRAWIIGVPAALLAVFALMELPSIVAGPIILGTAIVAGWLFLRWVGGDMGHDTD